MKNFCDCCQTLKEGVAKRRSKLSKGVWFHTCEECAEHEPRHWMVLVSRTNGVLSIAKFVKAKRYCGDKIALEEVL